MCMAIHLPATEVVRRISQLAGQLTLFSEIADLNYPDPGRWTNIFALPQIPIYRPAAQGGATMARWPFLPPECKSMDEARFYCDRTGNCRADEMFTKPTWKVPARERRCLIPVLGYYEHQHRYKPSKKDPVKVAYRFHRRDSEILLLAGLWQEWHGEPTVTICTMPANSLNAWVHNSKPRQPTVIPSDQVEAWIDGGGPETIEHLLVPRDDDGMVAEETEGSTGKRVANPPAPPPGGPSSLTGELFSFRGEAGREPPFQLT